MTPANRIIAKFGGHAAVAEMLGLNVSSVHRWTYSKADGGTGGSIPMRHIESLLSKAKERRIKLKLSDFFEKEAA